MPVGKRSGVPVSSHELVWIIAIIGRGSLVVFGIPACHSRMSRISMLPRRIVGWKGGTTARRAASRASSILMSSPTPTPSSRWVPGQSSVAPFAGETSTVATLITSCAAGCATSSTSSGQS